MATPMIDIVKVRFGAEPLTAQKIPDEACVEPLPELVALLLIVTVLAPIAVMTVPAAIPEPESCWPTFSPDVELTPVSTFEPLLREALKLLPCKL